MALAGVGPLAEETVPLLGRSLQGSQCTNVRLAAIAALRPAMGPDAGRATDDLVVSLADKVPSVRRASATALAVIAPRADPQRINKAVPALARALNDTDPEVRRRAVAALGALGARAEAATAALADVARTPGSPVSREAALALGRIGGPGLTELMRNLEHADASVRVSAAQGLQSLGFRARPALAPLARALTDKDPTVRQVAAAALRASDPEPKDVLPVLQRSLAARDDNAVRFWAVTWVGDIGAGGVEKPRTQGSRGPALPPRLGRMRTPPSEARRHWPWGTSAPTPARPSRGACAASAMRMPACGRTPPSPWDGSTRRRRARRFPCCWRHSPSSGTAATPSPFNREVALALATIGSVEYLWSKPWRKAMTRASVLESALPSKCMGPRAKGAFKYLQKGLQNAEASARQRSAEAMQAIQPDPKEAVPVLVLALRHDDDYIRRWAAAFLAELGRSGAGPEVADALPPLLEVLKTEAASDVRAHAVRAIGEILAHVKEAPKPAVEQPFIQALVDRLQDANAAVRLEATASLGTIGAGRKGQGPIGQAIPALLEALTRGRPYQAEAANALGQIGQSAPLLDALKRSPSERIRAGAAHALQLIGPTEANAHLPAALVQALGDKDAHVRHQAALALGSSGRLAADAVPALTAALEDSDSVVPPGAALALTLLGPEAETAAGALGKALTSPSPDLRSQAQAALVAIGPAALPALRTALKSKDVTTVILAAQALQRIGPKARPAIPDLVLAFGHAHPEVKRTTADALVVLQARTPDAIPALTLAVGHPDLEVALAAVGLLQELKANTPEVVTALAARLEENPNVSGPNPKALELHKLLVRSLGNAGANAHPAVPELAATLDNSDLLEDASQALLAILGRSARGADLVKALKEQDQLYEREIALVLGSADAEVVPGLISFLGHPNARVRAAAALSLGHLGPKAREALPVLVKTLSDGNARVRFEVLRALAQQAVDPREAGKRHPEVLAALEETLKHWDPATQVEAALWMARVAVKEPFPTPEGLKTQLPAGVLIAALKTEADPVRQQTLIGALKELASIGTDLHLAREMEKDDLLARERVALALGMITHSQDNEAASSSLIEALKDRHLSLRRQAARALGQLAQADGINVTPARRKEASAALETALRERDSVVRQEAALALWRFTHQTDKALPVLLESLELQAFADAELIAKLRSGKLANPVLIALVDMAEEDEKARNALAAALNQDNERLRTGVIVVVGSMKKPPADLYAQPLAAALVDRNATIRLQAAAALRHLELNVVQQGAGVAPPGESVGRSQ